MLFWGSGSFYQSNALDRQCIVARASEPTSHDAIFHTILPLFDIHADVYEESLDAFSDCRKWTAGARSSVLSRR
jgi:lipid A ethanolaminephosphotransferase